MQAPTPHSIPPTPADRITDHIADVARLLSNVAADGVAEIVELIHETRRADGVVYVFGNGGSAATAMHFCNDLHANCAMQRPPLRVSCLASNLSTLLALANDTGYENVFVGQLQSLAPEDTVIAISASGNSENCVRAVLRARELDARSVGLVGFDGGRLAELCDHVVHVARHDYLAVEDVHSVLCHAIARSLGCA